MSFKYPIVCIALFVFLIFGFESTSWAVMPPYKSGHDIKITKPRDIAGPNSAGVRACLWRLSADIGYIKGRVTYKKLPISDEQAYKVQAIMYEFFSDEVVGNVSTVQKIEVIAEDLARIEAYFKPHSFAQAITILRELLSR